MLWPGIEGYNYPFQTPYASSWGWFIDAVGQAAEVCAEHGCKLFLEHKNSEPAMKILMRNIGMTLHVIHKLRAQGITNVQVNMDWQHLIMNGEIARRVRRDARRRGTAGPPARELRLGHLRRRQHGRRDGFHGDPGARARVAARELRRERRAARLRPLSVYRGCSRGGRRSVHQWDFIDAVAGRIDDGALREAQARKDAVRAYELVYAALGAPSPG